MIPRRRYAFLALAWFVAEVGTFWLVAHVVGFWGAVLIGILTSLAGAMQLKRLGLGVAASVHRTMTGGAPTQEGRVLDGVLSGVGALLLILPGFLSDFVGLALSAPSLRAAIGRRVTQGAPPSGPRTLDLEPHDWTRLDRPAGG